MKQHREITERYEGSIIGQLDPVKRQVGSGLLKRRWPETSGVYHIK